MPRIDEHDRRRRGRRPRSSGAIDGRPARSATGAAMANTEAEPTSIHWANHCVAIRRRPRATVSIVPVRRSWRTLGTPATSPIQTKSRISARTCHPRRILSVGAAPTRRGRWRRRHAATRPQPLRRRPDADARDRASLALIDDGAVSPRLPLVAAQPPRSEATPMIHPSDPDQRTDRRAATVTARP